MAYTVPQTVTLCLPSTTPPPPPPPPGPHFGGHTGIGATFKSTMFNSLFNCKSYGKFQKPNLITHADSADKKQSYGNRFIEQYKNELKYKEILNFLCEPVQFGSQFFCLCMCEQECKKA